MQGKFSGAGPSASSFYPSPSLGIGYGNWGMEMGTGSGIKYSDIDGAAAADHFSGFALSHSYLGHYYTQVSNSACMAEKIIEILRKVTFFTGDCKPLLHQ